MELPLPPREPPFFPKYCASAALELLIMGSHRFRVLRGFAVQTLCRNCGGASSVIGQLPKAAPPTTLMLIVLLVVM